VTVDELRARVDAGEIDTVLLALCDMQDDCRASA
jgi:hypothetical protein